jgi:hypothetical protein
MTLPDSSWNFPKETWETKDSGQRDQYSTGMVRDTEAGKPRFDLLFPLDIPFESQMLTRFAGLMARGAEKYDERNWELAATEKELARYKSSASRHLIQWLSGEVDEDHAAAVMFNLMAAETVKYKLRREETNGSSKGNRDEGSSGEESGTSKEGCSGGQGCTCYAEP